MYFLNRLRQSRRSGVPSERRKLRERGAAALEFALIAPVFFLVVFGGIEIGLMFRSHLALQDMSRSAARIASVQRDDPNADIAILRQIHNRSSAINGEIRRVVIFSADTLNSDISLTCKGATSSLADQCNVYPVDTTSNLKAVVDAGVAETALSSDVRGAWDNIGIYIEYDYQYATGFFDKITLSTTTVEVIELDL